MIASCPAATCILYVIIITDPLDQCVYAHLFICMCVWEGYMWIHLKVQNNVTAVHVNTKILLLAATKGLIASICGVEDT